MFKGIVSPKNKNSVINCSPSRQGKLFIQHISYTVVIQSALHKGSEIDITNNNKTRNKNCFLN